MLSRSSWLIGFALPLVACAGGGAGAVDGSGGGGNSSSGGAGQLGSGGAVSTGGGSGAGDGTGGARGDGGTAAGGAGAPGSGGNGSGGQGTGGQGTGGEGAGGMGTGGGLNAQANSIFPGYKWRTTDGTPIRAIGGDIFEEDGTYYWYGATFDPNSLGTDPESDWFAPIFEYINCYSSTDLVHWTDHGAVFTRDDLRAALGPDLDNPFSIWVGRPGAWKNSEGKYVINFGFLSYPNFLEGEGNARNQVAALSSDTPTGHFAWQGYQKLLGTHTFNDNSVFNDTDGSAYFVVTPVRELALEGDPDNDWQGTMITQLGPSGYFPTQLTAHYPRLWSIEAPSLLHHGGMYYLYASDLDGWYNGNSSRVQSAGSLTTFVDDMSAMTPLSFLPGTDWGYDSQIDFVLAVGEQLIYGGDRWSMWTARGDGENIWLPMNSPTEVEWHDEWALDIATGAVTTPSLIKNGTFEAIGPEASPMSCLAWSGSCSLALGEAHEGSFAGQVSDDQSVSQTVSGLDAGATYELTGMAKATSGSSTLSVGGQSQAVTGATYEALTLTVSGATEFVITLAHEGSGSGHFDSLRFVAK